MSGSGTHLATHGHTHATCSGWALLLVSRRSACTNKLTHHGCYCASAMAASQTRPSRNPIHNLPSLCSKTTGGRAYNMHLLSAMLDHMLKQGFYHAMRSRVCFQEGMHSISSFFLTAIKVSWRCPRSKPYAMLCMQLTLMAVKAGPAALGWVRRQRHSVISFAAGLSNLHLHAWNVSFIRGSLP